MPFPKKVTIREVGPREGFQTLARVVPTSEKVELISALLETGVPSIEVTSFVRPDKVPQMADAETLVSQLPASRAGTVFTALYLNRKGFERCVTLPNLTTRGWLYTATSETFLSKNNNCSLDDTISGIPEWLKLFESKNIPLRGVVISTAFGCGYEGKAVAKKLGSVIARVLEQVKSCGVVLPEISLADTVGLAVPPEIDEAIQIIRNRTGDSEVSLHLHDTRGMGIACAYAGLQCGVSIFEASVGGMGGCPFAKGAAGNIATEDFVYLCESVGVATGVSLEKYVAAARVARRIAQQELPGRVFRIG